MDVSVHSVFMQVSKSDIMQEMHCVTEGVVDVIVYPSAVDKTKNRGFAFIEYESHRSAAMARKKLMTGRVQLWGHSIAVDWAEPELEVDQEIMAQVIICSQHCLTIIAFVLSDVCAHPINVQSS